MFGSGANFGKVGLRALNTTTEERVKCICPI